MRQNLIDSKIIKKLQKLSLNSNITADKGLLGGRKSISKGSSAEFSDFREYTSGDDFRKIDWNAYARLEKLFIKIFSEEREANINIFLDTTKSMDFGNPKKSFIGSQIAAIIAYVGLSNMDKVSIYTNKAGKLDSIENIRGKMLFMQIINYLESLSFTETTDFLKIINKKRPKKGISIIISDLLTEQFNNIIKYFSYMNQSIIVIHILSEEELNPQYTGDTKLIDSETKEGKNISITPYILQTYNNTLKNFIIQTKEICRKYGCLYTFIENENIEQIIFDNLINSGILR